MWAIMKQTRVHCMCMSSLIGRPPLVFLVPLPLLRCPQPESQESGQTESLVAWLGLGCAKKAVGEHPSFLSPLPLMTAPVSS